VDSQVIPGSHSPREDAKLAYTQLAHDAAVWIDHS